MPQVRSRILPLAIAIFCFYISSTFAFHLSPEWSSTRNLPTPQTNMRVILALQQNNLIELERLFWERSDPRNEKYAQYFTAEQLADLVAPSNNEIDQIYQWLFDNGFTLNDIDLVKSRDAIYVHGPVERFERLFQVKFEYFRHAEVKYRTILRASTPYTLPQSISSTIQLVHGVNDFPPLYRRAKNRLNDLFKEEFHFDRASENSSVNITSVNARSQAPGPAIIVNLIATCGNQGCPTTAIVSVSSANPNILFHAQANVPTNIPTGSTSATFSVTIQVQNYIPLNVSVSSSTSSGSLPVFVYTYPVVVNPHVVPQTLWDLYSMGRNPVVNHPNATQCVVEFEQQYYSPEDLNQFFELTGLPLTTPVTVVGPNDASNPGGEANLDIQWIMAMAPGSPTWFWSIAANSTIEIDHILTWCYEIGNTTNPPLVNSLSYGMTEGNVDRYLGSGYLNRTNAELQKLALQGLTIIIADGDTGANDLGPPPMSQLQCDPSHPDWPSDSAYVVSVGSTFITPLSEKICYVEHGANCLSNPLGEVTVSVDMGLTWTTGGGFSFVTPRPSYQNAAVESYFNNPDVTLPPSSYYNAEGRAYADVSTVGHNLEVVLSGSIVAIDGTSASAPIFGGIVSVLNNARLAAGKTPLGFITPMLYSTLMDYPSCWNDVTVGHNKCGAYGWKPVCCENGYTAADGWDPISGVGTPNVEALKRYVVSLP